MDFLFDTPWWFPTAAIGAGAVILFTGLQRGETGPRRFGAGLLLIGIVVAAISYFVQTDKEKAVNRTYRLVRAVNDRDWETFRSLLDPQTSFYTLGNREALVELVKQQAEILDIKSVRVTGTEAEQRGPIILVSVRVLAEMGNIPGGMVPTDWQLQWQNFGQGGILYNIRALPNDIVSEESIRSQINRR